MKKNWCCKNIHVPSHVLMSLALSQYHFATPEIRLLMRHILGYALSGRTIKRLAKSAVRFEHTGNLSRGSVRRLNTLFNLARRFRRVPYYQNKFET